MTTTAIISVLLISAGAAELVIVVFVIGLFRPLGNERRAMRAIIYALIISAMFITAGAILVGAV